jgi:hypothetical protein
LSNQGFLSDKGRLHAPAGIGAFLKGFSRAVRPVGDAPAIQQVGGGTGRAVREGVEALLAAVGRKLDFVSGDSPFGGFEGNGGIAFLIDALEVQESAAGVGVARKAAEIVVAVTVGLVFRVFERAEALIVSQELKTAASWMGNRSCW